jgi:hypothetical protein
VTAAEVARTPVGAWEEVAPEIRADIKLAAIQQLTRRLDRLDEVEDVTGELAERRVRLQRAIAAAERLP